MLIVKNLVKTYYTKGGVTTKALDDVSINFPETGMIFLLGKSGSGKSTLLNMIGGLDRPDSGEIIVKGKSSKDFSTIDFDSYRNTFIGFIFQEYNILNEFNVEQNIALALQLQGKKADKEVITNLLKEVDLVGLEKRKPNTLSGGQKQRIAIARALIKEPQIIMADEPTGALDSNTGKQVFDTLKKLSAKKLVIIVSHDREFAQQYGDRIVELKDGKIISDESKVYQEAKKISENVNLVNTNIIQIKNATKLTAKDNKAILDALKKQKGEVLISSGDNEVRNVKKALKINENGKSETFDNTKEVKVNQYDASQTTFIKSKMPFWRAFKIGVSGLKVKPFRLIMTILLSTVSFAMFGVASTLMLYNPNYSIREAMRNVDYKTETINKKYKYKYQNIVIDYETGDTQTKNTSNEMTDKTLFGENELKELNNNSTGLKFAGMFNFADSRYGDIGTFSIEGLNITDETVDYFASENVKFSGFSDCGEDYMKSQGFSNCYNGTYPDEVNEIAISDYIANAIIQGNVLKDSKVSQPKDLVNKKITVSGGAGKGRSFKEELTITGVYHIADIPNTYDSLKTARNTSSQSTDERNKIKTGMTNFLNGGFFRIAFVSNDFYDAHKDLVVPPTFQNDIPSINLKGIHFDYTYPSDFEVNSETWESAYDYNYIKESSSMQYYDINTGEKVSTKDVKLEQGQAIVSQSVYNELIRRSIGKYGCVRDQFDDLDNILVSCEKFIESMAADKIKKVKDTYYEHYREILDNYGTYDTQFYEAYNKIKDCLDNYYNYLQYLYYGYTLNNNEIIYTISTEYPEYTIGEKWNNFKTSLQKFNSTSETITTYDINYIHDYVYEYIDRIPELQLPLFRYIGEKICDYAGVQYNNEIYSKDGNIGYQELVNNLYSIEDITPEFKAKTKELSAKIYSTAIDLDDKDSYFPDDHSVFNPRYEFKAVYFYKTWDSSLGVQTLNVDYYYENSQGNYSTPIVNHELVNTYIADKNVWLSNIVTTYEAPSDAKYNSLMTVSNYSDNQIDVMIKDYGNYLYEMNNATYQQMSIMIQLVNQFKQIFLYVGIGTGVLAALLFANFISASINNKKKDIGILRAVGAKSTDVFKVFWSESGVIALICFVLAAISAAITCASLNNVIVGTLINIKVLNFSIVNILIILGASILISLLATLIPVIIAAKKPPVEAIRSL